MDFDIVHECAMELDNARSLEFDVFERVFKYAALNSAAGSDNSDHVFVNRSALDPDMPLDLLTEDSKIAVGIGVPRSGDNRRPNDYRLKLYLQEKRLRDHPFVTEALRRARSEAEVTVMGPVRRAVAVPWQRRQCRPLRIGASVGHARVTAGTIGAFVEMDDGKIGILSNNHVLADVNRGRIGDAILQPGRADGGDLSADHIGMLERFIKIDLGIALPNRLDCALASLRDGVICDAADIEGLGTLGGTSRVPVVSEPVAKLGRTTDLTRGFVHGIEVDNLIVRFASSGAYPLARFDGQLALAGSQQASFAKGGDSGSLIVGDDLAPLGLLFAISPSGGAGRSGLAFANPIGAVLNALGTHLHLA